jgi:release factor glutamine methyltransferase
VSNHTLEGVLRAAKTVLSSVSQSPRLDAELLLAHVLGCDRSSLHAHPEAVLTKSQSQQYAMLLERRASGEPLAYILGFKEFWSLPLRVTRDVLIPRPETELVVELALARIPEHETLEIADLGTGSGAIALAIAHERPDTTITATDISQAALAVATDNANRLGLINIQFLAGDWFANLGGRLHLIVSNPPYVDVDDPYLEDPALNFEPRKALISAENGLADLRLIAQGAGAFLYPGGWLIVEHGVGHGTAVRELFQNAGFQDVSSYRDLAQHQRTTAGRRAV